MLERIVGREWGRPASHHVRYAIKLAKRLRICFLPEVLSERVYERSRYTHALNSLRYLAFFIRFIQLFHLRYTQIAIHIACSPQSGATLELSRPA